MALEYHDTMVPAHQYANVGNDTARWDDGWFSDTVHARRFRASGDIEVSKNIELELTTFVSQCGMITKEGDRFIHDFNYGDNGVVTTDGRNTNFGLLTGNLTAGSTATTASQASYNCNFGYQCGTAFETAHQNANFGYWAGKAITTGYKNVNVGMTAGYRITTGHSNSNVGYLAGEHILDGYHNTNIGANSGAGIISGYGNVCVGWEAGLSITSGYFNTNVGAGAGRAITTGWHNTNFGYSAGRSNTSGTGNTGFGYYAGGSITIGGRNCTLGQQSGFNITEGNDNTTMGYLSGGRITTGNKNTCIGRSAGQFITGGSTPNLTPVESIYIGYNCQPAADAQENQIVIGYLAVGKGSNTITLGNTSITDSYFSAGNVRLPNDNAGLYVGAAGDALIYYDAANLVIDPDAVGTGKVLIGATADDEIDAGSYSVGGAAGASGTFTTVDSKTVTVTNGIITSIV